MFTYAVLCVCWRLFPVKKSAMVSFWVSVGFFHLLVALRTIVLIKSWPVDMGIESLADFFWDTCVYASEQFFSSTFSKMCVGRVSISRYPILKPCQIPKAPVFSAPTFDNEISSVSNLCYYFCVSTRKMYDQPGVVMHTCPVSYLGGWGTSSRPA